MTAHLAEFVPEDLSKRRYHEPFVGAGSLYFFLRPKRATISDVNPDLMNAYQCLRRDPKLVSRYLSEHARCHSKTHYYQVRHQYNQAAYDSSAQAARFIYLNRACFNGIFRVNRKGDFNVPFGRRPILPDSQHVALASRTLRPTRIRCRGFVSSLRDVERGDFVYLDPPYPPLNGTSFFHHYTSDRFSKSDQENLAEEVRRLDRRGCLVLMSNADVPLVEELYSDDFKVYCLDVTRYVTSGNVKHKVSELIITNY